MSSWLMWQASGSICIFTWDCAVGDAAVLLDQGKEGSFPLLCIRMFLLQAIPGTIQQVTSKELCLFIRKYYTVPKYEIFRKLHFRTDSLGSRVPGRQDLQEDLRVAPLVDPNRWAPDPSYCGSLGAPAVCHVCPSSAERCARQDGPTAPCLGVESCRDLLWWRLPGGMGLCVSSTGGRGPRRG
jgi:hypothetical protein